MQSNKADQLVSIIIPAYRRPLLLDRLLRSIAQFTEYPHFEVIVRDDGSPDDELKRTVSRFWPDINVEYSKSKENMGIAATRNSGINAASGNLLCQMDSDTVVSPGWLTKLIAAKKRWDDKHAEVAIVAALLSHQVGYFMCRPEKPINDFDLIQVSSVGTACTLYHRELIKEIGLYDEDLYNLWSDLDFCLRLGKETTRIAEKSGKTPKIVVDPSTVCFHHGWIDPESGVMEEQTDANTRSLDELNDREHKRRHLNSMSIMKERWGVKHPEIDILQAELQNLE